MGDAADYYTLEELLGAINGESLAELVDPDDDPRWRTQDGRILRIREMTNNHLTNAIRYLEVRGARTPEQVSTDLVSRTEAQMVRLSDARQKKYLQLLAERERRAKVPASDNAAP